MLEKIRGVRQDEPSRQRHWYQDDFFDLFVWTGASDEILAFQLCYDRQGDERVLAWTGAAGFIHRRIDGGEQTPLKNMAPIMVTNGRFPADGVAAEFERRASGIEPRLRDFIQSRIGEAGSRLG